MLKKLGISAVTIPQSAFHRCRHLIRQHTSWFLLHLCELRCSSRATFAIVDTERAIVLQVRIYLAKFASSAAQAQKACVVWWLVPVVPV